MRDSKKTYGVYVIENRKFYYLEDGGNLVNNHIDKLLTNLLANDIIKYELSNNMFEEKSYRVMTLANAVEEEIECLPIYLTAIAKNKKENTSTGAIKWGKK